MIFERLQDSVVTLTDIERKPDVPSPLLIRHFLRLSSTLFISFRKITDSFSLRSLSLDCDITYKGTFRMSIPSPTRKG